MIKPKQVPQSAWLAMRDLMREGIRNEATLIAAALNAWPGFHIGAKATIAPYVILPITQTQENSDE